MTVLRGRHVVLRPAELDDVDRLTEIRSTPEVHDRWGGDDVRAEVLDDLADDETHPYVVEVHGTVLGVVQWSEEPTPMYRHASIDIFLDPAVHGRGLGSDAVATLARHLVDDLGHRRLVIDPATDNAAAIACYRKVGFRPVGVMRRYERAPDGSWHDGLLMDLLADELVRSPA